jgi:hypothetical protein
MRSSRSVDHAADAVGEVRYGAPLHEELDLLVPGTGRLPPRRCRCLCSERYTTLRHIERAEGY